VYLSGFAGLDPSTNKMVDGDTVAQAKQTFLNMKNVLEAANSGFGNGNSLSLLTLPIVERSSWFVL
jgi:enamine deaminase RidA (YjgF/YER057c/UK114 family)